MREYKFRVFWYKDKITTSVDTIEFLHGGIRVSDGCYHIGWQGKDCELREFTGLHDKNGKEIYEGDILRDTDSEIYYVDFIRGCFYLKTKYISFPHLGWTEWLPMCEIDRLANPVDFEIIGNIYDNPELLKEGSV